MSGPLEGIKVVEMGVWVAAPAAGCILGDWGADVVKIEPPGIGDPARLFSSMYGVDLPLNPPFEMDNRNKRSIVVDARSEAGQQVVHQLLAEADVFISNVRPAGLARLGLGHEALLERYPRLVYGMITGYGLEGAEADRAAYDIAAFWARSGIAAALTREGQPPPAQRGGMGDHNTGLALAGAVSAALFERERTGRGQLVSTSLLREGLYTLSFDLAFGLRLGVPIQVADRRTIGAVTINSYADRDGRWFWIVGLEGDRHWAPLARAVGRPEWIDDPRYATQAKRAEHAVALIAELDAIFATRTREEWGLIFDAEVDLWWAPVQTSEEVMADPQVEAAGGFAHVPDQGATTTLPATPVDFKGAPVLQRSMAPEHGQHTDEVLAELGYGPESIAGLRAEGIVGGGAEG
jgi:crotonobetainyl-CoA:carnitine CoA-transferase CaiB-like acyl-CoA transferase